MINRNRIAMLLVSAAGAAFSAPASAQIGYGVNSAGSLFSFSLTTPNAAVNTIGNVGFVPEGLDFRPGSSSLYALNVGPTVTQLYTIDIATGVPTVMGGSFPSAGVGYDLTTSGSFGFDFNPTTLQGDMSMRIRLVGTSGVNLRLNSSTGLIQDIDPSLLITGGASPFVDAAAYTNSNAATMGGITTLFDLDSRNDNMSTQDPGTGILTPVGSFGFSIDANLGIHFDILTALGSVDTGIGGDTGYAVFRRTDAPVGNPGAWLLYNVNLGTGATTMGALVGVNGGNPPADFTGGLAVIIPAPATFGLASLSLAPLARRRRR